MPDPQLVRALRQRRKLACDPAQQSTPLRCQNQDRFAVPASSCKRAGAMSEARRSERIGRAARFSEWQLQAWVMDLKVLQDTGFVVLETRGSFNQKVRHASQWRLTEFASDISHQFATRDYLQWRPAKIQNTVPQQGPTVPVAGQHGPSRRTEAA
jgi:hypothetical protein